MDDKKKIRTLAEIEKEAILESMERHDYNISTVAEELGVTRYLLYCKVAEHNILKPKIDGIIN